MADMVTENYTDAQGRPQTRQVYADQQQGTYRPLTSEAEASQGVKELFKKAPAAEKKPSEMSLGELAAYNKKKRDDAAKAQGQKQALGGSD